MPGQAIDQALHGKVLFHVYVNECATTDVHLGYSYSRPARADDPLLPTTGADNIPEEFYADLSQFEQKQLGPGFAAIFDNEKVRKDRVLHWLMRSTMVPLDDTQDLADRGVWLIGDAAQAITDAIDLAENLSNGLLSNKSEFLVKRHREWRKAGSEIKSRL